MRTYDVVVLGAGLAGVAVARALCAAGVSRLLIIERESSAGAHASGRSAGLVRTATEDAAIAPLAREGAAAIRAFGDAFRRTGSLLLGGAERLPEAVLSRPEHRGASAGDLAALAPLLDVPALAGAIATSDDGWVDVPALLERMLAEVRAAGGEVRYGLAARAPRIARGAACGVDTDEGAIACKDLVVATGAWAAEWGEKGGIPVSLRPFRRHLAETRSPAASAGASDTQAWPWVWDLERRFYFRGTEAGMLWCACDDVPDAAGDARADAGAWQKIDAKIASALPRARPLDVVRVWAGHRTFASDRRFLLGPDPRLAGWHWAAALGGHGVTVANAIGRRVAAAILGDGVPEAEFTLRTAVLDGAKG
ncbi:MAG: FAD-binding oxidoreductase [Planctomycetes bacterium]|nr:FAD-binding oxidoreductase [Planctomycetota bacterium]